MRYGIFYHGTTETKAKKILKRGLKRPPKGRTYQAPIYLSEDVKTAKRFGKIILKIKLSNRFFENNCGYKEDSGGYLRSYPVCYKNIPAKMIERLK